MIMSLATFSAPHRHGGWLDRLAAIDAEGRRRQPLFWATAIVLLALMFPTFAAALLDGRTVNGINVWMKPLKFEASLALFAATIAWFFGYLPEERRRGRLLTIFSAVTVGWIAFEQGYITLQSARGVGSHFNVGTPIEGLMFTLMGIGALIFTAMAPVLGIAIARHGRSDLAPAFRLSVVLGLILTFVLGAGVGIALSINGGHWVGAPHTDVGGLAVFGWTRAGGDLRVAHFFGLHAMQILPLAGWLIARRDPNATGAVWAAAAAIVLLTVWTLVEALLGQPFLGFIG
jgi:hypothetical protein